MFTADPRLVRVLNDVFRPFANAAYKTKTAMPLLLTEAALVADVTPQPGSPEFTEIIDDGRREEGLKEFTAEDLANALTLAQDMVAQFDDDPRWASVFKITVGLRPE